ncbi:MAG: thioredoxin family protein, partial [Leptospiraceae bacterium]|nr:thioredoxin family protein [Leptospiraceae bacterium]
MCDIEHRRCGPQGLHHKTAWKEKNMLDQQLLNQLKDYFKKLDRDVTLLLPEGNHEKSAELKDMLDSVASTSDRINVEHIAGSEDEATDNPDGITFEVLAADKKTGIRFRGIPGGHEFSSLILAILQAGGVPVRLDPDVVTMVGSISEDLHFETVVSLDCHNCPDVVQTLNALSIVNDSIHHDMIDGALYPEVVQKYGVQGVPAVFLNGEPFSSGKVDAATIIGRLMERAGEQAAKQKDNRDSPDSASA